MFTGAFRWGFLVLALLVGFGGCSKGPVDQESAEIVITTDKTQYASADTLLIFFRNELEYDINVPNCYDADVYSTDAVFSFEIMQGDSWQTFYWVNDSCSAEELIWGIVPSHTTWTITYPSPDSVFQANVQYQVAMKYVARQDSLTGYSNAFLFMD